MAITFQEHLLNAYSEERLYKDTLYNANTIVHVKFMKDYGCSCERMITQLGCRCDGTALKLIELGSNRDFGMICPFTDVNDHTRLVQASNSNERW